MTVINCLIGLELDDRRLPILRAMDSFEKQGFCKALKNTHLIQILMPHIEA